MNAALTVLLVLLFSAAPHVEAACDPSATATTTPRAGLQRPATKQCDWNVPLQSTIDSLDSRAGFLDIPSTWSAKQTFGGGLAGDERRLGGLFFDLGIGTLATSDSWIFRLDPVTATVTRIECEAYTGTSFTIKVCKGEDLACTTNLLGASPLVCTTAGASSTTITAPSVAARDKVTIVITAVSGAVSKGEIYIEGRTT